MSSPRSRAAARLRSTDGRQSGKRNSRQVAMPTGDVAALNCARLDDEEDQQQEDSESESKKRLVDMPHDSSAVRKKRRGSVSREKHTGLIATTSGNGEVPKVGDDDGKASLAAGRAGGQGADDNGGDDDDDNNEEEESEPSLTICNVVELERYIGRRNRSVKKALDKPRKSRTSKNSVHDAKEMDVPSKLKHTLDITMSF